MPRTPDPMTARQSHLTPRDKDILDKLGDHKVLSTDHAHQIWFPARRTAELRLNELLELDLLSKFTFARPCGGTDPYLWTLGVLGHQWHASRNERPEPSRKNALEQIHRAENSKTLSHLLLVNDFFARLAWHTRHHREASLQRWWAETKATSEFRGIQPDGHALYRVDGEFNGLFLEADTGTEPLTRVVAKLTAYRKVANNDGPRYPVLFWLPSRKREDNLLRELAAANYPVPAATATKDADPGGPVWRIPGSPTRMHFWELSSDHGKPVAGNPNFGDDGELDLPGRDPFHYQPQD